MLDQCVSLGGGLRLPTSALALAARRSLKRPRLLLLGHPAALFASSGSQPQQHQHQHQQRENPRASFPVAIVGAGPAGLTLSALLSKFGVPSILLERAPGLPTHPQAHFINLRSMEILRHAFGGLDSRVLEICPPQEEWRCGSRPSACYLSEVLSLTGVGPAVQGLRRANAWNIFSRLLK